MPRHRETPPLQTYLVQVVPRMFPGLVELGQEKGMKTKGFGQKRKAAAHKGRKKKSRVRA